MPTILAVPILTLCALLSASACSDTPPRPDAATTPSAATPTSPQQSACASTEPECQSYLAIWREVVISRSAIDGSYFDAHVVPIRAAIETWADGRSLRVRYRFTFDWVSFEREDVMIVYVDPDAAPYPSLGIPKVAALDATQIDRAAASGAWGTAIASVRRIEVLTFRTQDEALAALREHPDGRDLAPEELSFNRPGLIPRENGHPHLHARSPENSTSGQCSRGMIDLVTGEMHVTVDACRMTGLDGPAVPRRRG